MISATEDFEMFVRKSLLKDLQNLIEEDTSSNEFRYIRNDAVNHINMLPRYNGHYSETQNIIVIGTSYLPQD